MWVFLNGLILREDKARISPLDRGFTFADGVYEVIPSYNNKRFLFDEHLTRLKKSLNKLFIPCPQVLDELNSILSELHKKNGFKNQLFYIQITRGVQDIRSHEAGSEILPTVFITSQNLDLNPYRNNPDKEGLSVRLEEDIRWARCDIKATGLTGSILSSNCTVGCSVKLNTGSIVTHDVKIGSFSNIAPGAVVLGRVSIGQSVYVGANSTILPDLNIGEEAVIGAGAVVTKDVQPGLTVVGVPAKPFMF